MMIFQKYYWLLAEKIFGYRNAHDYQNFKKYE